MEYLFVSVTYHTILMGFVSASVYVIFLFPYGCNLINLDPTYTK